MTRPTDIHIYTEGGTVQAGEGVYIHRAGDDQLMELCEPGIFAYVLTARQMGKSSLMIRTAERLSTKGIRSVTIDLTKIGGGEEITAEQWYLGLLMIIKSQLGLKIDLLQWWRGSAHLTLAQRFTDFLEQILLAEVKEKVVIFIDEIDTTLRFSFTNDFFAAIRFIYNARASVEVFKRLSFVLIGVATPNSLISNPDQTPFNIGRRVDLQDFTIEEAGQLASGLNLPPDHAKDVLKWVFEWTGGHPYLTQRLCIAIAWKGQAHYVKDDIRNLAATSFFGEKSTQDSNLGFVRDMLTKRVPESLEPADILLTYRAIHHNNHSVDDEDRSLVKSHLKLSGVVCSKDGKLRVRNRIYKVVFDEKWIKEHLPRTWVRRQYERTRRVAAALAVVLLLLSSLTVYAQWERRVAEEQRRQALFHQSRAEELARQEQSARQLAEERRIEAERQKTLAEEAFHREQIARQQLEKQTTEAKRQRMLAVSAAGKEQSARRLAESKRLEAERQREIAAARGQTDRLYREGTAAYLTGDATTAAQKLIEALSLYRQPDLIDVSGEVSTLKNIGYAYRSLNQPLKALEYQNQALLLYRQINDRNGEASVLIDIAVSHQRLGEIEEADASFNKALEVYKQVDNLYGEMTVLGLLGWLYNPNQDQIDIPGDPDPSFPADFEDGSNAVKQDNAEERTRREKAIYYYSLLAALYEKAQLLDSEAATFEVIARLYNRLGDRQKTIDYYVKALTAYQQNNNKPSEADLLRKVAATYYRWKDTEHSIEYYNKAVAAFRNNNNALEEARLLTVIAGIYNRLQDKQKTLDSYQQAFTAYEHSGNYDAKAKILKSVGDLQEKTGEREPASESYRRALLAYEESNKQPFSTDKVKIIAALYKKLKENEKAAEYYTILIKLYKQEGDIYNEADSYKALGYLHYEMKEYSTAIQDYKSASSLYRSINRKSESAEAVKTAGVLYIYLREHQRAMDCFKEAADIYRQDNEPYKERQMIENIGDVYYGLGNLREALATYKKALDLPEFPDAVKNKEGGLSGGDLGILNIIGRLHAELGENEKWNVFFSDQLRDRIKGTDRIAEAKRNLTACALYIDSNELQLALGNCDKALPIFEQENKLLDQVRTHVLRSYIFKEYEQNKSKALTEINKAYDIAGRINTEENLALGQALVLVATGFDRLGERQKWSEVMRRLLSIPEPLPEDRNSL